MVECECECEYQSIPYPPCLPCTTYTPKTNKKRQNMRQSKIREKRLRQVTDALWQAVLKGPIAESRSHESNRAGRPNHLLRFLSCT